MPESANTSRPRVVMITGGLGDIGRAIGRAFAAERCAIAVSDLSPAPAAAAHLDALRKAGAVEVDYASVDTTQEGDVESWVGDRTRAWGAPWVAVPNAAVVTTATLLEMPPAAWRREIEVNLTGAFLFAAAAARSMVRGGGGGRIVFVGSWAAEVPHPHVPAYGVSKAGLRMLVKCLAAELAPSGILVNEVAPGYVDAGLSRRLFEERPDLAEACRARVPLGRLIAPEEIAAEVLRLAAQENRHQTGTVVLLDGGLSLGPLAVRGSTNP